jgi:hypothetical protein
LNWLLSHRYDAVAAALADRHYSRRKHGAPQFSPPGKLIVLVTDGAAWTTIGQAHQKHRWPGAWMNSLFRRERGPLASLLIREACAASRALWGDPPAVGMVSFVDAAKVRAKRDPGYCYLKAGFERDGETSHGLLAFRLPADRFPPAEQPLRLQLELRLTRAQAEAQFILRGNFT